MPRPACDRHAAGHAACHDCRRRRRRRRRGLAAARRSRPPGADRAGRRPAGGQDRLPPGAAAVAHRPPPAGGRAWSSPCCGCSSWAPACPGWSSPAPRASTSARSCSPGVLATSVMFTAVFSGVSVVWDREFGFLREMLVAPISRTSIMAGKCLGGAIVATAQALVLVALAGLGRGALLPGDAARAGRHPVPGVAVDHRLRPAPGGQGGQHPVGDARDPDGDHADDVPVGGALPDRRACPPGWRWPPSSTPSPTPSSPCATWCSPTSTCRRPRSRPSTPGSRGWVAGAGGPAAGGPGRPRHGRVRHRRGPLQPDRLTARRLRSG